MQGLNEDAWKPPSKPASPYFSNLAATEQAVAHIYTSLTQRLNSLDVRKKARERGKKKKRNTRVRNQGILKVKTRKLDCSSTMRRNTTYNETGKFKKKSTSKVNENRREKKKMHTKVHHKGSSSEKDHKSWIVL